MSKKKKVVAVIPARYKSTRFEGKPLAKILGKPMIYHVYENIKRCASLDEIIIATDDERIQKTVTDFGGKVVMTSSECATGTDRVAEAARMIQADIIVNVQGDEPMTEIKMIEDLVRPLLDDDKVYVTNLVTKIFDLASYVDTTVVKAALDLSGNIMFLTRAPIPYPKTRQGYVVYQQIGAYAFRKDFLLKYAQMPQTPLELIEGVEFLRILENGLKVKAVETDHQSMSVDTLSDLIEVEKIMKKKQLLKV